MNSRIRAAKFTYLKHLEELDINALSLEAQKHYQTLKSLDFIEKKQNVIVAGNPGTSKSHTVIGLGIKACQAGYHVYFSHVPTLIIELKEAKNGRVLQRLKKKFDKYHLVILDEIGYISFDKEGVELLFNFISTQCEKASTMFTTNLSFSRWDEIFHASIITAAMVDRITHQSYVINMDGTIYRIKQSKKFLESK
ncbi:ATP-binding protein [Turicibacter sanguinis]|uniref:ATP-binding protein n=1 Tax=Turicibacter sanguinis TaxID=154288 RepID=UPI002943544F|nr:ATP-binding protein [Turicibacter sanguinis]